MPARRLPVMKAGITGAATKNPGRFANRANPKVKPVGDPPPHLSVSARRAWRMFVRRLPWLTAADEAMLGLAAMVQGALMDGEPIGVAKLNMFQTVLSKLGASPTDRTKVTMPEEEEEEDEFFGKR